MVNIKRYVIHEIDSTQIVGLQCRDEKHVFKVTTTQEPPRIRIEYWNGLDWVELLSVKAPAPSSSGNHEHEALTDTTLNKAWGIVCSAKNTNCS